VRSQITIRTYGSFERSHCRDYGRVGGHRARDGAPATEPLAGALVPVRCRYLPGALYIHDLALVGGRLHANAVALNAVVELPPEGGFRPVWWPRAIDGVEMDLRGVRYATFEDLRLYCYRVASAVGLVSIEIFGYRNPACRDYAIQLGLALQVTNIIRDVGEDARRGPGGDCVAGCDRCSHGAILGIFR